MPVPFTDAPLACSQDKHDWVAMLNDHGDYYEVCQGCGKQAAWTPLWEIPPVNKGREAS